MEPLLKPFWGYWFSLDSEGRLLLESLTRIQQHLGFHWQRTTHVLTKWEAVKEQFPTIWGRKKIIHCATQLSKICDIGMIS